MQIPKCYEATNQFAARDRAEAKAAQCRPKCQSCGEPILTELILDLRPFGIAAFACQRCVDRFISFNGGYVC